MALEFMSPRDMTDAGMYAWAGVVTVVGLVASYLIALGWQRWKEGKSKNAR